MTYILIAIISLITTGTVRPSITSFSQEFNTQQNCQTALENVRNGLTNNTSALLLTCEKR